MAQYLIRVVRWMVLLMWAPAAAFAAVLASTGADASPLNIPSALLVATLLLSTLAGATTLAQRLVSDLRADPPKPLVKPWLYCVSHMLGSWLSGAFFFLACMSQGTGVWTLLCTVLIASFLGAKALEAAAEKWLPSAAFPKGTT